MDFSLFLTTFQQAFSGELYLLIILGVFVGILAGAMPGLSPSSAVALLVPFSYTMGATEGIVFLTAIYIASNYGGSITAILINTPGTPASSVTAIDGYELTQKGKSGSALSMSLLASTLGGAIGIFILIFLTVPLAKWALKLGPAEYFSLAILGLSTVASMGKERVLKSLLATGFGLFLATIGTDHISGETRFTFGLDVLEDGFHLIPVLIGLFALSITFENFEAPKVIQNLVEKPKSLFKEMSDGLKYSLTILKSSFIGTIIGVFPGAGATIASFISYDIAKKSSKEKEKFGHGSLDGVAASEAANSSSVGGALIPLLAFGIPGSATDAVLIGAFMLHDLTPGPLLFEENKPMVYTIFLSLIIANFAILFLGSLGNRLFSKITKLPSEILFTIILMLAILGSYSINSNLFDVYSCIGFGLVGFLLKKSKYPMPPIVLGFVLGKMIEENFRRAMLMDGLASFYQSYLSMIFLGIALISIVFSLKRKN